MNRSIIAAAVLLSALTTAQAGVRADLSGDAVVDFATTMDMPFMTVGNPGNAGDTEVMLEDGTTGYGAVDYVYHMGKFEVTAGQYTEFLNAVADTDAYGLYSEYMSGNPWDLGCGIQRSGSAGAYTYSVATEWEDRAVSWVNWGDAARFANWLTNGMPTGAQDLTTTEDGSYFLNGATGHAELLTVTRKADARYVIPSEDEWYKAAYHKNDGVTGNYFDYPTSSDSVPSNDLTDPDPGNNANFYLGSGDWTIGSPYYRTEAGEFENSDSPYGTYDMGGNLFEWSEGILLGASRVLRGGAFYNVPEYLHASFHYYYATQEHWNRGFRVAEVPEPATLGLLALGGVAILRRKK